MFGLACRREDRWWVQLSLAHGWSPRAGKDDKWDQQGQYLWHPDPSFMSIFRLSITQHDEHDVEKTPFDIKCFRNRWSKRKWKEEQERAKTNGLWSCNCSKWPRLVLHCFLFRPAWADLCKSAKVQCTNYKWSEKFQVLNLIDRFFLVPLTWTWKCWDQSDASDILEQPESLEWCTRGTH